jgi:hypothetical protein
MSAPVANTLAQVITSDSPLKENNSKSKQPAKNRTAQITEVFEALPQIEGFPLTTEQLWSYFKLATKDKNIGLRKLSEKKELKADNSTTVKRRSGYNLYLSSFKKEIPEGIDRMTHIGAEWQKLSPEEKEPYEKEATDMNASNGIHKKPKKLTYQERCAIWEREWKEWVHADHDTRGPEPIMPLPPTRKKKTEKETTQEETVIKDMD